MWGALFAGLGLSSLFSGLLRKTEKPKVITMPERKATSQTASNLRFELEQRLKKQRSRQESNVTGGKLLSPLRKYTPTLKERLGA